MTAAHKLPAALPACWGVDPELFFGPADSPAKGPVLAWEQRALGVCTSCPVSAACLAAALEFPADEQHGVVGGMTAAQRRALLRESHQRPTRSSVADTPNNRQRLVQAAIRLRKAGHGLGRSRAACTSGNGGFSGGWPHHHAEGVA